MTPKYFLGFLQKMGVQSDHLQESRIRARMKRITRLITLTLEFIRYEFPNGLWILKLGTANGHAHSVQTYSAKVCKKTGQSRESIVENAGLKYTPILQKVRAGRGKSADTTSSKPKNAKKICKYLCLQKPAKKTGRDGATTLKGEDLNP